MSRYIDLDKVIDKLVDEWGYEGIREDLYELPTADVEKVIRCKDCKYCDKEDEHEYWCTGRGFPCQLTTPDDYCSKGRKRGDVEEVRHGEWIPQPSMDDRYSRYYICSVCGRLEQVSHAYDIKTFSPYCHCGAKMDKEKEK